MTAISFKDQHFQRDMIVQSIRWYLAYALSYRDIEEMMQERGFSVDHSTINQAIKYIASMRHRQFSDG